MQIRYIEYGKIFLKTSSRGAMEYSPLNRSDDELIKNTKKFYLNEIATFRLEENSEAAYPKNLDDNKNSVALVLWDNIHYLFMQLQQKREDEIIDEGVTRNTQRTFNQARFIFLTKRNIKPKDFGLTSTLAIETNLPDYIYPIRGEIKPFTIIEKPVIPHMKNIKKVFLKNIINSLYNESQINTSGEGKVKNRTPKPVFIKTDLSLDEKIRYFDEVQYWAYPALGIITFASSYITNRQVTLHLGKDPSFVPHIETERVFEESELSSQNFVDYFGAVQNFSSDDLYHETLEYYLRLDLHPSVAVILFNLIEKDDSLPEEEVTHAIITSTKKIKPEHLRVIFQKHIVKVDPLLKRILREMPANQRVTLLGLIQEYKSTELDIYVPLHFAALYKVDVKSKDALDIRSLFKKIISLNSDEKIDLIKNNEKENAYAELILADCDLDAVGGFIYKPRIRFSRNKNGEEKTLLDVLMQKEKEIFLEVLASLFAKNIIPNLQEVIEEHIEKSRWDIETVSKFWRIVPHQNESLYASLLKHIAIDSVQSMSLNQLAELQSFLIEGHYFVFPAQAFSQVSSKNQINNVAAQLRENYLRICFSLSVININFGYWWLTETLVYDTESAIRNYYKKILENYQDIKVFPSDSLPQATFLLSGGRSGQEESIYGCVSSISKSLDWTSLQEGFYITLLSVLAENQYTILAKDIINLIKNISNSRAKSILKLIQTSGKKEQTDQIKEVNAESALVWLKETKQERRLQKSEEDILPGILLGIKHPDNHLIRHIILSEPNVIVFFDSWAKYSQKLDSTYKKTIQLSKDVFIEDYIQTTSSLNIHLKVEDHPTVSAIVYAKSVGLEKVQIEFSALIDFMDENKEISKTLEQGIDVLIKKALSKSNAESAIKRLTKKHRETLREYVLNHTQFEDKYKQLVENNFIQQPYPMKVVQDEAGGFKKGEEEPVTASRKGIHQIADTSRIQSDSTSSNISTPRLETTLYIVLVLIICFIVAMVLILLWDAFFKFLYFQFT